MLSTKRASDTDASERPVKHPKFEEESIVSLSLDDINDHCVLEILKCLSVEEELNSVAVFISKRYNELRNHDSLDQTRTGTIICTENTTLDSIRNAFIPQRWNQVFTGNRTRLKLVGLDRMPDVDTRVFRSDDHLLPTVTSLDISSTPNNNARGEFQKVQSHQNFAAFTAMLPNLEEIDLDYSRTPQFLLAAIAGHCRKLGRIKFSVCRGRQMDVGGVVLERISDSLTELHLDNSHLIEPSNIETYENEDQPGSFLLHSCKNIEQLSIKNLSWSRRDGEVGGVVSQAVLIKMVRNHPALRWIRSDLTKDNIAMLQQERRDITFVSE